MAKKIFRGPAKMLIRRKPDLADDPDWTDPTEPITDEQSEADFWGVDRVRPGLGPLKQVLLDFVFLDDNEVEIAGVTFDYVVVNLTERDEIGAPTKPTFGGSRPFVRTCGAGTTFDATESMRIDVSQGSGMSVIMSNIVDATLDATHCIIYCTEVEYK